VAQILSGDEAEPKYVEMYLDLIVTPSAYVSKLASSQTITHESG